MSISYVGRGTSVAGVASVSPTLPLSITTDGNSILVLHVTSKYPGTPPNTPVGWTPIAGASGSGGAGAVGVDAGDVLVTSYYLIPLTAPSAPTVTAASASVIGASIELFSKSTSGSAWDIVGTNGSDTSPGTTYSVICGSMIDILGGDMVLVSTGTNSNASGAGTGRSITVPGCVVGAHVSNANLTSSLGDHLRLDTGYTAVTSGTASGEPGYNVTYATSAGSYPAGSTNIMRLREINSPSVVTLEHDFDGIDGDDVIEAGAGPDALSLVYRGAGQLGTISYGSPSLARGAASATISTITSSSAYIAWDEMALGEGNVTLWGRLYVWMTSDFAAPVSILQFASNSTSRARVQIGSDRKVRMLNAAGVTIGTTAPINLDAWVRIECMVTGSASGAWYVSVYASDSTTAMETISGNADNFSGVINTVRFGLTAAQANVPTLYLDDIGISNIARLGPALVQNVAPIANAGVDQIVEPGVTVTLTGSAVDDSGVASLSWVQLSGTPVTLVGSGASRTFVAPCLLNQQDLVFQLTASDGSLTGTDTVHVTVLEATELMWNGTTLVPVSLYKYDGSSWI